MCFPQVPMGADAVGPLWFALYELRPSGVKPEVAGSPTFL